MDSTAAAFQLIETDEGVRGHHTRIPMDELGEGDVLIRVTHSSVNYKDGLAATGRARIARTLPLVGGCCAAGVVVEAGEATSGASMSRPGEAASQPGETGSAQAQTPPGQQPAPPDQQQTSPGQQSVPHQSALPDQQSASPSQPAVPPDHQPDPGAALGPGTAVAVIGATLSEQHNGGYCEYLRVPAAWVTPVPEPFTTWDAAAIGTAGVTSAMAVAKLEDAGCTPGSGPVAVTGASGGSGSIAVALLAARGYEVTAITGQPSAEEYLRGLGATHVEPRPDTSSTRPLEKGRWAAAIDTVGGPTLAWLTRTVRPAGSIAAFGNAGGNRLETTMLPFILRGINLLGVTVTFPPARLRARVWRMLAESLSRETLATIASEISFDELGQALERIVTTGVTGRLVVRIAGD